MGEHSWSGDELNAAALRALPYYRGYYPSCLYMYVCVVVDKETDSCDRSGQTDRQNKAYPKVGTVLKEGQWDRYPEGCSPPLAFPPHIPPQGGGGLYRARH